MNIYSLAYKNLKRHRVRTVLTVVGIAISTLTLFAILSFNSGYDRALKSEMSGSGIHMFVSREGCPLQAASLIIQGGEIPEYLDASLLGQVKEVAGVKEAGGFLISSVINRGKADLFYGITPEVLKLKPNWRLDGGWFKDGDSIILGAEVAMAAGKKPGDRIRVESLGRDFLVSGVIRRTGGEDDSFYFLPIETAQQIFDKGGKLTAIGVQVEDVTAMKEVRRGIERLPGAYVVPAEDMTKRVLDIVGGTKSIMFAILVIVLVVSGLGVFNTVMMATFERRDEFGYLRCVGAKRRDIFKLILIETIWLCGAGLAIGVAGGFASSAILGQWIRRFLAYAPAGRLLRPDILTVLITAGVVVFLGLAAGLYPGYRASRVPPMEAIRNE